jgi:hypothetical protein
MDNDEKMMQQIMEILIKMNAAAEKMDSNQEKMAADKEDLLTRIKEEDRQANQDFLARMEAIFDDNRKKAESDENFWAKMDAFHEERMAMIDDEKKRIMATWNTHTETKKIETDPGMMQSAEEHQDTISEDVAVMPVKGLKNDEKKRMMATWNTHTETKKIKTDPGMMQSAEEHQYTISEDVAVMPVKGLKKRSRGRKWTAGRRGEPKELTRGNGGSRKKLAAACRKVSRHAAVVWKKRKLFRISETCTYFGLRKGVTVADRRTSRNATVAWRKRKLTRNIQLQENHELSKDVAVNGMREGPECKSGIWRRDVKRLPHLRKERKSTNGIKGWRPGQRSLLGKGGTLRINLYEIFGGKITKQVVGTSRRLRRIGIWRLWRGRPPPKRKKKLGRE